jgi:glycosyltransferase involved in cell wall biosynthesis
VISFCIPFRADKWKRKNSFEFVRSFLEEQWPDDEVIEADTGELPFGRSSSRNYAAKQAKGDVLIFLDADSFVWSAQIQHAVHAARSAGWSFPYDLYHSLTEEGSVSFMNGVVPREDFFEFTFPGPDPIDRPASVGGCVVVRRDAFETVGGYDERFVGWSFEDRAFASSLAALYGPAPRIPGPLYHLWHPAPEEECFGQPHMEENRSLYNRYREAEGNPPAMRALVIEHG